MLMLSVNWVYDPNGLAKPTSGGKTLSKESEPGHSSLQIHSFILRIRCEDTGQRPNEKVWRGSIEQVGGDQCFFFQDLESILDFVLERVCPTEHSTK